MHIFIVQVITWRHIQITHPRLFIDRTDQWAWTCVYIIDYAHIHSTDHHVETYTAQIAPYLRVQRAYKPGDAHDNMTTPCRSLPRKHLQMVKIL